MRRPCSPIWATRRSDWLQADLFDGAALAAAGITTGSLQGVLEHTCFCAIDPTQREAYLDTVARLLAPGGWLLGLFWCHQRPDGPPWGSDPALLAQQLKAAGFRQELWEPAQGSAPSAITNGWDSGGGECMNQKTIHTASGGSARMAVTNDGPFYGAMFHGAWAGRNDNGSSNAKLTDHR